MPVPETSTTLLRDLKDAQHARWGEFVERYRPMMEAYMRERFPSVEADDAIQETLVALCRILPDYRYAPDEKGHFRNYLTGILRNKALRAIRRRNDAEMLVPDVPEPDSRPAPCCVRPGVADEDAAWRDAAFEIALARFREDKSISDRTKRIFERTAINGEPPESVAAAFKMKRHAVDQAKSRALSRLREIVRELEALADE